MKALPLGRWIGWIGAVLALALVFAAWRNPHLALDLANLVAGCFQ